jgi:hypothetical protein
MVLRTVPPVVGVTDTAARNVLIRVPWVSVGVVPSSV